MEKPCFQPYFGLILGKIGYFGKLARFLFLSYESGFLKYECNIRFENKKTPANT